ncbi:unnamed protein product [Auanema sp. JU1783]|nr:unnamed protein product [Auanema sp. JU1783]
MSANYLYYDIISCSSKDKALINFFKSKKESTIDGNEICWFTKSGHSFPQSIIMKLEEETQVEQIEITAHPKYLPSSVTISFGIPDDRFANSIGKSYNASYKMITQLSFMKNGQIEQTQRVTFSPHKTLYIRLTVHGFVTSIDNPEQQIGILAVIIRGFASSSTRNSLRESEERMLTLPSSLKQYMSLSSPMASRPRTLMNMEYDSDDEEILFSLDMVKRLKNKSKVLEESMEEKQMLTHNQGTEEDSRDILKEIESFQMGLTEERKEKKFYFGKRLSDFNNLIRLLESKKEESIWQEKYDLANDIDVIIQKLKNREKPLKELLVDRTDALDRNDLIQAQRLKSLFDENLEEVMDLKGLEKYLSAKEIERIKHEANQLGLSKS